MKLGDRMKQYEAVSKSHLMAKTPAIIRIDGKAFHTWTRGLDRPFDQKFYAAMAQTASNLVDSIQGAVLGYGQSDEISILLVDASENNDREAWFKGSVQKIASVAASYATGYFNSFVDHLGMEGRKTAFFDARVFTLPPHEVCNYFIWRQQDCIRNSIQSTGQTHLGHKKCQGLNNQSVVDALRELDDPIDWYHDVPPVYRYGYSYTRGSEVNVNIPVFKDCREFIDVHIQT